MTTSVLVTKGGVGGISICNVRMPDVIYKYKI